MRSSFPSPSSAIQPHTSQCETVDPYAVAQVDPMADLLGSISLSKDTAPKWHFPLEIEQGFVTLFRCDSPRARAFLALRPLRVLSGRSAHKMLVVSGEQIVDLG
jgi:hypothetical protein